MTPQAVKDRAARAIRRARLKEGLEPRTLAFDLDVDDRTLERWENAEVYPQLRNRNALVARLEELELEDLQPDLAAEERELRDQLERIEETVSQNAETLKDLTDLLGSALPLPADRPSSADSDATDSEEEA